MSDEELLAAFRRYKNKVGPDMAISALTAKRINARTAYALAMDEYDSKPRKKLRGALEDIIKRAG